MEGGFFFILEDNFKKKNIKISIIRGNAYFFTLIELKNILTNKLTGKNYIIYVPLKTYEKKVSFWLIKLYHRGVFQ